MPGHVTRVSRDGIGRMSLLAAAAFLPAATATSQPKPQLSTVATSRTMLWNGVVASRNHLLVAGPRWSGSGGPAVARIEKGEVLPFPNRRWNSWHNGAGAADRFVDVNAIHEDGRGAVYAVDTGAPTFGGNPVPGGAKLVKIDLTTNRVTRVYRFGPRIARAGSYVDDVRFHGRIAYLTDAGNPGLIVLDLQTGASRRVLDDAPSTTARADRPIVLDGKVLKGTDGQPLKVNSDPMEISPDGKWLYFGPLEGPWSMVPTRLLDDPSVEPAALAAAVRPWADIPPIGGSAMDPAGNLYFSDLARDAIRRRAPDGKITTIVQDKRIHWVDALYLADGELWMPEAQLDRTSIFHHGRSQVRWPTGLYRMPIGPQR